MYDISLGHTSEIMNSSSNFFRIEERLNGGIFWKGIRHEKLGGLRFQYDDYEYDISTDIQNVFTDTTEKSQKKV